MRINYRGKDVNLVSVGPSRAYDHTTLQAAVDDIEAGTAPAGAAAKENPYLVTVAPGEYVEDVEISSLDHTEILGEGRSIIRSDTINPTIRIAQDSGDICHHLTLTNLWLVAAAGNGCLQVCQRAIGGLDEERVRDLVVQGCRIDGQQLAVQVQGQTNAPGSNEYTSVTLKNNIIQSARVAFKCSGSSLITSHGNLYRHKGTGIEPFHTTPQAAVEQVLLLGSGNFDSSEAAYRFSHDHVELWLDNGAGFNGEADAIKIATTNSQTNPMILMTGMHIYARHVDRGTSTGAVTRVTGIYVDGQQDDNRCLISGGQITVHQILGATDAPDLIGVDCNDTQARPIVAGPLITIHDQRSPQSTNRFSLREQSGTMIARIFSQTGVSGTPTQLAMYP